MKNLKLFSNLTKEEDSILSESFKNIYNILKNHKYNDIPVTDKIMEGKIIPEDKEWIMKFKIELKKDC